MPRLSEKESGSEYDRSASFEADRFLLADTRGNGTIWLRNAGNGSGRACRVEIRQKTDLPLQTGNGVGPWDRRSEHGPFDIIGDVHGCCYELEKLLKKMGYLRCEDGIFCHPKGRKAVFCGDLVDRGSRNVDVLRIVSDMVRTDRALAVIGNHDDKLLRFLKGNPVQVAHGLEGTYGEIKVLTREEKQLLRDFLDSLPDHLVLDDGKLVVVHAGIREDLIGTEGKETRRFCMHGETNGEYDDFDHPVRLDWTSHYTGNAAVVYGHCPWMRMRVVGNTYGVDTGVVFGNRLTALRYPEMREVSTKAKKPYYKVRRNG